jgi:hypothetical protein
VVKGDKHLTKCSAQPPSLPELTRLLFSLKAQVEKQQREIDVLKGKETVVEFTGVTEPPTMDEDDLLGMYEHGMTWVAQREKHQWNVIVVKGKSPAFYIADAETSTMVKMTDDHWKELHGNLRKQFSRLLTVYVERNRLLTDGDPKGMYPNLMQAIFKLTPAKLKSALQEA